MKLILPRALRARIAAEAQAAFPRECCGLIEGTVSGDVFRAQGLHPARNDAPSPDRFAIAPAHHFAALRAARANGHGIIGCYHSHPNGEPEPSRHDAAGAEEENFLWLIAATAGKACRLGAFVYRASGFEGLPLGADCVTSSLKDRN